MEITIVTLVLIAFIAGVVGGIIVADEMDTYENRRAKRRAKRKARRNKKMEKLPTFYIDFFNK